MGTVWKTEKLLATKALDNCSQCGLWPFVTGMKDPFLKCCIAHDAAYIAHENNLPGTKLEADQRFLGCMLAVAGESRWLRTKASVYYLIVRGPLGWIAWNF